MKIALILVLALSMLLCGCNGTPAESGTLDYDAMDEKYGQDLSDSKDKGDDSAEFSKDIPAITECLENYTICLLKDDAKKYMEYVPDVYITAIAEEQDCTESEAKLLAQDNIIEEFNDKSQKYSVLKSLIGEDGCSVSSIDSIHKTSESTVKEYTDLGIASLAVIDVEYTVTAGDESVTDSATLVKLADGTWALL